MNDRLAFLEAILESPHDDAPSLIFADWLEEEGELDRADLIRAQAELATAAPEDPNRVRLEASEYAILSKHYEDWRSEFKPCMGLFWGRFEIGLIRSAALYADDADYVEQCLGALHAHWPVRRLWLPRISPSAARIVAQSSRLRRITELRIDCEYDESVNAVLRSPHLTNLAALECVVPRMIKSIAHWLDDLPLPMLKRLRLIWPDGETPRSAARRGSSWTGTKLARSLVESRRLTDLERLDLSGLPLGHLGVKRLAESPSVANLRSLKLSQVDCGDKGIKAIAESPCLARLTELIVSGNRMTDEGAAALAQSKRLTSLAKLDLSGNQIGDAGLSLLAQSTSLAALTKLNAVENPIPFQDHRRYQGSAGGRLRSLDLSGGGFPTDELSMLAEWPVLSSLATLKLNHARIGDEGATYLANWPALQNLERLELAHAGIGDQGGLALASRSSALESLLWLDVTSAQSPRHFKPSTKTALRDRFAHGVVLFSPASHTATDDAH